jgi:hypothetical protein
MKLLKEILNQIFIDIMKELYSVSKLLFTVATLTTFGLTCLGFVKPILVLFFITYPVIFLAFLCIYNFSHAVIIEAKGIRDGVIPQITKPDFPFLKVIGSRKIKIVYNSSIDFQDFRNQIETKLKTICKYNDIYYYGLISVPLNVSIGYRIGQKIRTHIYNFDRTKSNWLEISNFDKINCFTTSKYTGDNPGSVNIVLPFSYRVDLNKINNGYDTYVINLETQSIDLDNSYASIMKKITDIIIEYDNAHFFTAINNGLAFYLGMRLNDSNLPNAYFYEYGGSDNPEYTFSINIKTLEKRIL